MELNCLISLKFTVTEILLKMERQMVISVTNVGTVNAHNFMMLTPRYII